MSLTRPPTPGLHGFSDDGINTGMGTANPTTQELIDIVAELQLDTKLLRDNQKKLEKENDQLKRDLDAKSPYKGDPYSGTGPFGGGFTYGGLGASQHAPTPPIAPTPRNPAAIDIAAITAAVTTALATVSKQSKARIATPNNFDGSKDKVDSFLKQCSDWLIDNKVTDDQEKICLIGSYFKEGEAADWAVQNSKEGKMWPTIAAFTIDILARFGDTDPEHTARMKLEKIKHTSTIEAYITEFKKYARQTGFSDVDLIYQYQKGLNDGVLQNIYRSGTLPNTLQDWYDTTNRFDQLWKRLQALRPNKGRKTDEKSKWTPPANTSTTAGKPAATSADYKAGTSGPMDIGRARREGKCRHCEQPWTISHTCEKKRLAQQAYQQRSGAQRNEVKTEAQKEEQEAELATLKDQIDILRKQLKEAKDAEN
jgi:hypothetical protein